MPKKKSHIKPSKEELQESIKNIAEEVETGMDEEAKEVEELVEDIEKPIKIIKPAPEPEVEPEPEPEIEEEVEEVEEAEPSKEIKEALKVEVKEKTEKLSASAREVQKINAKNRVLNQAIIEADEIPEPTDEELQVKYPDWDVMSEVERKFAKETEISVQWRTKIKEASNQATKIVKWNESVETYAEDPKTLADNPELEGKTELFKEFAQRDENNSVPFGILVSAFLHEDAKAKVSNKGKQFETTTGGGSEKPKLNKGTISLEDSIKLRDTNYDKYKELLKAGKIESDL